jgi:hypothetical protein
MHRITRQELDQIKAIPGCVGWFNNGEGAFCAQGKVPMLMNRTDVLPPAKDIPEYMVLNFDRFRHFLGQHLTGEQKHQIAVVNNGRNYLGISPDFDTAFDMMVTYLKDNGHLEVIEPTPELNVLPSPVTFITVEKAQYKRLTIEEVC